MNDEARQRLDDLFTSARVASLATVNDGQPYVSMVPFALLNHDPRRWVIHVSQLAAHTQHLQKHDRVSAMMMATEDERENVHALPRLMIQARAEVMDHEHGDYLQARSSYLKRFPDMAELFKFSDFKLVLLKVEHARWIAGFAQAYTIDIANWSL